MSEELEARRSEEESWSEPTDHDRVVAALAELDEAGVIARAVANVREAAEDVEVPDGRLGTRVGPAGSKAA